MRFAEIIREDEDSSQDQGQERVDVDANIVTALDVIRHRILDDNLPPEVPINVVLRFIQNTGIPGFTYHDLVTANEAEPSMKNIIKNITSKHVTFVTDTEPSVTNTQDYEGSVDNPQQVVSNMAKSAMKRRQS